MDVPHGSSDGGLSRWSAGRGVEVRGPIPVWDSAARDVAPDGVLLRRLLTERDVSFTGDFYRFERATIEPLLPHFPELLVGGGSKLPTPLSPDKPSIARAVLARIAVADGWLGRAAGSQQIVKEDVRAIRAHLATIGRDPASLRYGHLNFAHLVDTDDREEALRLRRPVVDRVMGTQRTFEQLQQSYVLGTTREIVDRVRDLEAAGIGDLVLASCDDHLKSSSGSRPRLSGPFQAAPHLPLADREPN